MTPLPPILAYFPENWGLKILGVAVAVAFVIASGWGLTWLVTRRP